MENKPYPGEIWYDKDTRQIIWLRSVKSHFTGYGSSGWYEGLIIGCPATKTYPVVIIIRDLLRLSHSPR